MYRTDTALGSMVSNAVTFLPQALAFREQLDEKRCPIGVDISEARSISRCLTSE